VRGVVESFDEAAGLGWIVADDGRFLFHCTQIADGSRTIRVGVEVIFESVVRFGHDEATAIQPA
jgi:cold shock CspA family protein